MIHLVTSRNAALYSSELESLHRARKAVFVDELGWRLPVRDGLEYDEYDDERACNVMGFSVEGEVVMGLRFRPTDDRSMLVDHFPHVLAAGPSGINGPRTWELTRGFCTERGVRKHHLRRKAACMIAPLEIALAAGVERCVGFTDVRMLNFCYGIGWTINLLGPATPYGEGDAVAYEVEVSDDALDRMRRMWGLPRPAYVEINGLEPGERTVADAARRLIERDPGLLDLAPTPDAPAPAARAGRSTPDDAYAAYSLANADRSGK